MNALIPNEVGIWIECCNPDCKKWRYTLDFDDPLLVPKNWYCYMNSNQSINSCCIPECLKLVEGEIFVESKFKAGCIVWAKVIGHPWSPAMIDFCPEWECYYWFDFPNTNVPSQYHVTFLSGKQITRAWLKTRFIKSFVENKDPSFALKARVCNKKLSLRQQADIIEGCRIATAALSLSISRRLKKYNYNSWRLAQRFQDLSVDCGKTPPSSSDSQYSKKGFDEAAGASGTERSTALKNTKSKKPVNQSQKPPHQYLGKPKPSSIQRSTRSQGKVLPKQNASEQKSPRQKKPTIEDSEVLVKLASANTKRTSRREDLDDTRSINSISSKDFSDVPGPVRRPASIRKRVVGLKLDDGPEADVFANGRLSSEEINETAIDEIIPNSQESTPSIRSFNQNSTDHSEVYIINKENQPRELSSSSELGSEEMKSVLLNSKNFQYKSLSLTVRSVNEQNSKRIDATSPKSMSESLIGNKSQENHPGESRYRRALSEFKSMEQNHLPSTAASFQREKVSFRKPLPNWFTNSDERRKISIERMDILRQLSEEEDERMYKGNRASFIAEMESANASFSGGANRHDSKAQKYFIKPQNMYDYLLSSDEDSF